MVTLHACDTGAICSGLVYDLEHKAIYVSALIPVPEYIQLENHIVHRRVLDDQLHCAATHTADGDPGRHHCAHAHSLQLADR